MDTFLTQSDYRTLIQDHVLNQVINNDPGLLDDAELMAISEMEGYLSSRYDTQAIFSKTGDNRHKVLVMFALDMTLYHLHSRVSPRNISQLRVDRYNRAIEWLQNVVNGALNPDLPFKKTDDGDDVSNIRYGSNDKFNHYY